MNTSINGRGLGHIKDTAEKRWTHQKPSHDLLGATPTNPAQASLEKNETAVLDQGQSGSCTAHGTAMALWISAAVAQIAVGFLASMRSLYAVFRTVEKSKATDALSDSGAMPADIPPCLATFGIRPMQGPTPDGRNSDIWSDDDIRSVKGAPPANVNEEEDLGDLLVAGKKVIVGIYRVDETKADFLTQIEAAIAQGYAVGIGIFVDSAFESWSPTAQPEGLKSVNFNDPNGGGHWICLDAYKTNADGSKTYSGPNSWGSWGAGPLVDQTCQNKSGHWRATDAWMRAQASQGMDIYVFKLLSVSS